MASISISCPSCSATEGVVRNGKSTAGHQRYLCSHCRKTFTYTASQPGTHQKIIDMAMNGVGCRASARIMGVGLNTILRHFKKLRPQSVNSRIQPGSDVIVCVEMDEQWGYVGAKSRKRWLFYAYDRIRRTVVAHVFGERTLATLEPPLGLLSAFEVVVWMTDGWPLYESRLKGELDVISKRYTQRIERHNLNLRQHLARLGRKSLSFSKSVELHDKVIGHYLNIKHYQ
ncbi:IS1 family transposase [Klebsiella pneumoniae]|uniref:IS1 family transposase n=1 Tax=Klebsiella pneumoniae complex TaxID=3390273 RepID=UPI001CD2DAED|nr:MULTISPECIES: IS1 family transposase [Klebsiella]MCD5675314.1 IS1 family transposase [Klebsiella pneumoniae]MCP6008485.1 IS1 family transposase [Klebsiella pneumoniae]MCS6653589.1 IS1 family transposase [Klebsiella pneumoniae subsp. pneumoniae]MCU8622217.1 IS1 family transposase [Klebsiella pneumoniae]MCY0540467.1 IS1 family transposase [Klebsiella pneumoniae]